MSVTCATMSWSLLPPCAPCLELVEAEQTRLARDGRGDLRDRVPAPRLPRSVAPRMDVEHERVEMHAALAPGRGGGAQTEGRARHVRARCRQGTHGHDAHLTGAPEKKRSITNVLPTPTPPAPPHRQAATAAMGECITASAAMGGRTAASADRGTTQSSRAAAFTVQVQPPRPRRRRTRQCHGRQLVLLVLIDAVAAAPAPAAEKSRKGAPG